MAQKVKLSAKETFLEAVIRWGILVIFATLPLLYFSGRIASYVTSKQYFLIGSVEFLTVLWTWLLISDRRYRLTKQNLLILAPLFLFLVMLTIAGFAGVDPATSFFSTVETGTGLVLLYHSFLFACITASFVRVRKEKLFKGIMQATLFASVVLAAATYFTGPNGLFDIYSEMLDKSSGGAMMGNSLLAGAYFVFSLFLTSILILKETKAWKKVLYWIGIGVIIFCPVIFNAGIFQGLGFSSTSFFIGKARIAVFAIIIGAFISLFTWFLVRKNNRISKILGILGFVIMVLVGGIGTQQLISPTSKLHVFFVKESGNRTVDWNAAIQGIKERPLLGWGQENFHVLYQKFFDPVVYDPGHGDEGWSLHPHNSTLEILVNGGLLSFIFYLLTLAILFRGLYLLYRNNKIDGKTFSLLLGMFIAFIIQEQMIYDSITSYTMFFALIGIIAGMSDTTDDLRQVGGSISGLQYAVATAIATIMVPVWIYAAYLPARKMEEVQAIATTASDKRTALYEHLFHSPGSYAINTDPEFFTESIFLSYDRMKRTLKETPLYQQVASAELKALLNAVRPILYERKYDYHEAITMIRLESLEFYLTGDVQELKNSDEYAKLGFALSSTDPDLYVAYAQTLLYEGKKNEAEDLISKALMLNPNYDPAIEFRDAIE